jgi:6-pyruvoyltetrahydropterin/6-carboxytetrahydropterin synthase
MKISNILIVKGNLLRSKTQLSFSKLLSFLEKDYEYNLRTKLFDRKEDLIDFKLGNIYVKLQNTLNDFFIIFVNQ